MAPASKKNARYKNKPLDYNSLNISDVLCPICRTIVIEPVSLPCQHLFCYKCFNCTIENNCLCCPICRLRIGSWLRSSSKLNKVINSELWGFIKTHFKTEVEAKVSGKEITFSNTNEPVKLKLSEPGEIRQEYEKQLTAQQQIYRSEREKEAKLSQELIKKLQEEENRLKLENEKRLERDAALAKELADSISSQPEPSPHVKTNPNSDITDRSNNLVNKSSLYRVNSRAVLASYSGRSDILYRYDYNVKNVQNNNVGKDSSIQVNMANNVVTSKRQKSTASKSFAKKLSQDELQIETSKSSSQDTNFGKKGSASTQQAHAMSLLRQLGQTYSENDEDAKKQDSITQELCHFRPIKSAVITRKRMANGKQLRKPLVYSPPRKPIARNRKRTSDSKTVLSIEGAKILTYSGRNSAFAAFPTIYFCANLIIANDDDTELVKKSPKSTRSKLSSMNDSACRKRLFDKTTSKSAKKSKLGARKSSDGDITVLNSSGDITILDSSGDVSSDIENFERLTEEQREKLVQERRDLELAKRLQKYLDQFDDDRSSYGLRRNESKLSSYVSRGTRTSPRKRQTTLDAIFLSARK